MWMLLAIALPMLAGGALAAGGAQGRAGRAQFVGGGGGRARGRRRNLRPGGAPSRRPAGDGVLRRGVRPGPAGLCIAPARAGQKAVLTGGKRSG